MIVIQDRYIDPRHVWSLKRDAETLYIWFVGFAGPWSFSFSSHAEAEDKLLQIVAAKSGASNG